MKLLSVNVSLPIEVPYRDGTLRTGIYKQPCAGPVMLRETNLDGDGQADLQNHGGEDKAVYAYPHEHYAHWQAELGRDDFGFGQFGENFTTEGLLEDAVCIGDVYRIGEALVQVTQPRAPCYKLEHKMQERGFIKRLSQSLRCGFYLRVLETGMVGAGDNITQETADPARLTVRDTFDLMFYDRENSERLSVALQVPSLADSWREIFSERLAGA